MDFSISNKRWGTSTIDVQASKNYLGEDRTSQIIVRTSAGKQEILHITQKATSNFATVQNTDFVLQNNEELGVIIKCYGVNSLQGTGSLIESGTASVYVSSKQVEGYLDINDSSWTQATKVSQRKWEIPEGTLNIKIGCIVHDYMGSTQTIPFTCYNNNTALLTATANIQIIQEPIPLQFTIYNSIVSSTDWNLNTTFEGVLKGDNIKFELINAENVFYPKVMKLTLGGQTQSNEIQQLYFGNGIVANIRFGGGTWKFVLESRLNFNGSSAKFKFKVTDIVSGTSIEREVTVNNPDY